jgi:hypothetical protein
LPSRDRETGGEFAKREGIALRQCYQRVAKRSAIMVGRYIHAHQFKRARRALKFYRARFGRIIRDIGRKIAGNPALEDRSTPGSISHHAFGIGISISADRRSIRCMPPR